MIGFGNVTWRCAKGLRGIDARVLRRSSVTEAEILRAAQSDDEDVVATLGHVLVAGAVLDVVYGKQDPDGYDVTSDGYYVEIVTAPRLDWVGFARVYTSWRNVPPYVPRGKTLADLPEWKRCRPVGFGIAGSRGTPPVDRNPAAVAVQKACLARIIRMGEARP